MAPFTFVRQLLSKNNGRSRTMAMGENSHHYIEIEAPESLSINQAQAGFYQAMFDLDSSSALVSTLNPVDLPQKLVIDIARSSLSEREYRQKSVPRLPTVIPKLLRSLRDPEASARNYVDIINKDPALSAAVLKLSNSVYFNPTTNKIDNIEYAVVKLGIEGLRAVLSAAVMQPLVQRKTEYFSHFGLRLWEHTLSVAVACETLATVRGCEPYKAYLLGLTHDIGKITLFSELSKQFRLNPISSTPLVEAFLPLLKDKSASLSAAVAMDWELPKEICAALQQQVDIEPGRQVSPYANILFQANLACEAYAVTKYCVEHSVDLSVLSKQLSLPETLFADLECLSVQV
jgi:HD-like signal output (HDOD) protein